MHFCDTGCGKKQLKIMTYIPNLIKTNKDGGIFTLREKYIRLFPYIYKLLFRFISDKINKSIQKRDHCSRLCYLAEVNGETYS